MMIFLMLPLLGAITGALVAYVGVKLLFWPRKPIKVGSVVWLGFLRAAWPQLCRQVIAEVGQEVLSKNPVENFVETMDLESEVKPLIDVRLSLMVQKMIGGNPLIAMFMTDEMVTPFKEQARDQLMEMIPEVKKMLLANVGNSTGTLTDQIQDRASRYDLDALERRVFSNLGTRLLVFGAVLGLVIGLLEAVVVQLFI